MISKWKRTEYLTRRWQVKQEDSTRKRRQNKLLCREKRKKKNSINGKGLEIRNKFSESSSFKQTSFVKEEPEWKEQESSADEQNPFLDDAVVKGVDHY